MKTMVLPSASHLPQRVEQLETSSGVSTAVGSSRIRMRASRYSAFRISTRCCSPTRQLPDARARVDGEAVPRGELGDPRSIARGWMRNDRPMSRWSPSITFSATVNGSTSRKCWWTMQMPASNASRGDCEHRRLAPDLELALVGAIEPGQDVRERALAGAVLTEQRVHLASATSKSTRSLARTPGNRLVIPRQTMAAPVPTGSIA